MPGPGWPGILLHEAIGQGWKAISTREAQRFFAATMGERIASQEVTVVNNSAYDEPARQTSISTMRVRPPTAPP